MQLIKIRLLATPIYTLKGKRFIYSLADMAYGVWIVFKDDYPEFYINILNSNKDKTNEHGYESIEKMLELRLKNIDSHLSLKQQIIGLKCFKSHFEWFELKEMAID